MVSDRNELNWLCKTHFLKQALGGLGHSLASIMIWVKMYPLTTFHTVGVCCNLSFSNGKDNVRILGWKHPLIIA